MNCFSQRFCWQDLLEQMAWQLKWFSTMRSWPNLAAFYSSTVVWIWQWKNFWQSSEPSCLNSGLLRASQNLLTNWRSLLSASQGLLANWFFLLRASQDLLAKESLLCTSQGLLAMKSLLCTSQGLLAKESLLCTNCGHQGLLANCIGNCWLQQIAAPLKIPALIFFFGIAHKFEYLVISNLAWKLCILLLR